MIKAPTFAKKMLEVEKDGTGNRRGARCGTGARREQYIYTAGRGGHEDTKEIIR